MARIPKIKELIATRLANTYGGWIYCESCGKNIGYLCYTAYDHFHFAYTCKCGAMGKLHISFEEEDEEVCSKHKPVLIKNRLCCGKDHSPLLTVLENRHDYYKYEIMCVNCHIRYAEEKTLG